ncbi:hypothetical protein GCM10018966_059040 [Streptomyces yanii]
MPVPGGLAPCPRRIPPPPFDLAELVPKFASGDSAGESKPGAVPMVPVQAFPRPCKRGGNWTSDEADRLDAPVPRDGEAARAKGRQADGPWPRLADGDRGCRLVL